MIKITIFVTPKAFKERHRVHIDNVIEYAEAAEKYITENFPFPMSYEMGRAGTLIRATGTRIIGAIEYTSPCEKRVRNVMLMANMAGRIAAGLEEL